MNEILKQEIKDLEFEFKREIKALEGIFYNNPSTGLFLDLVYIKYTNNNTKKVTESKWKASKSLQDLVKMLHKYNVFFKNVVREENIYFALTNKTKFVNFIWLDDIKLENVNEKQLEYLTLIETSPNNYQAYFKLNKFVKVEQAQLIKKYLVKKLDADKAATSPIQPMRIPGFFSFKRDIPFFIKVYRVASKILNVDAMLKKIQANNTTKQQYNVNTATIYNNKKNSFLEKSYYKKQLGERNCEFDPADEREAIRKYVFDTNTVDENIVDINYVYQLLIRGYSKSQILQYLLKTRNDLDEKHKINDYFERTYLKAFLYHKLNPNKYLYSNKELVEFIHTHPKWDNNKKVLDNLKEIVSTLC